MKKFIFTTLFIFITFTIGYAQHPVIDDYVNIGLKNNHSLQQKEIDYQKSIEALNEAKGMFLPSVNFSTRYTKAVGGREIEFPIGEIMNPVYGTLNEILVSMGEPQQFPLSIPDQRFSLLREEEHDTKIEIVQPIFQPQIYYNYKIKSDMKILKKLEKQAYTRRLVSDIKQAYFNYLKTLQIVNLYKETEKLLQENLRVSKKLYETGKETEDVVFSAHAELSDLEQKMAEADKNKTVAASYFNFLLNRPFDSTIKVIDRSELKQSDISELDRSEQAALTQREELKQLKKSIEISNNGISANKSDYLPTVTGVFDYGFQGEEYEFSEDTDYWTATLVMNWNIFDGFQRKSNIDQSVLDKKKQEVQLHQVQRQIELEVEEAYHNIIVAKKAITSSSKRVKSTKQSFNIISKKYKNGMVPQIEYLNARNKLTQAQINEIVANYDYFNKLAEYERVTSQYHIQED